MRPSTGEDFALVMPRASAEAMSVVPADAATLPADQHAVAVLDRAGWNGARALKVPETITLVPLPPPDRARGRLCSPEPGPVERARLHLRERHLPHRLPADHDAVADACRHAWIALTAETGRIQSLTSYPYLEQVKA